MLDPQQTAGYATSIKWLELAESIALLSQGKASRVLLDQLCLSAIQVSQGIAEGQLSKACGAVKRCLPLVDVLSQRRVIGQDESKKCYELLQKLVKDVS